MKNICDIVQPGTVTTIGFLSDNVPEAGPIQLYLEEIPWENSFELDASDGIRKEIASLLSVHSYSDWLFNLHVAEDGDMTIFPDNKKNTQETFAELPLAESIDMTPQTETVQLGQSRDAELAEIASRLLKVAVLDSRQSDLLDFHNVAVWQVKSALRAAYELGRSDRLN